MKPGTVLHEAYIVDGTGELEWSEWVVRSTRKGRVFATLKASWTWGKKSKKQGDYGWLDPIATRWRRSWREGELPPQGIRTTKIKALQAAIKLQRDYGADEDYDPPLTNAQMIRKLEVALKRERGKRKAK